MTDRDYMQLALELAEKGRGWVHPNPMVGAVVVKNNRIIGTGYHQQCGGLHAERNALAACKESSNGATMYVTLEPCCHFGKTPPCTDAIIENRIARVVIGSADPNPKVAGKGVNLLRQKGIEVQQGVLQDTCDNLNKIFFHFITTHTPYVTMKYAMTMDGKIATYTGKSKWITGEAARNQVQLDRHYHTGIMVGVGTVLADNPLLTCRLPQCQNPIRIVCDTKLRTPLDAQVLQTAKKVYTIFATCNTDRERHILYESLGCEIVVVPKKDGHVDLRTLMYELGKRDIDSILLEGGGSLNWSALNSGIVKKVQTYISPKLFGGIQAKSPIEGKGVENPSDACQLSVPTIIPLGDDYLLESEVLSCSQELSKK